MPMKMKTPDLPEEEFNMTPMIDIVFLLIVFFMVVAAQIIEKVPLQPPTAEIGKIPEEKGTRDTISINAEGEVFLQMKQVDLDELKQELTISNQTIPGFQVYLRADENTPHRYVSTVMQACAESGLYKVIFATLKPDAS